MKISYHYYSDTTKTVISIITVLVKCAENVQKVLIRAPKLFQQV